jgi:hypothetical protein
MGRDHDEDLAPSQTVECLVHHRGGRGVELRCRFVDEEQVGSVGEGARQHESLRLSTRHDRERTVHDVEQPKLG